MKKTKKPLSILLAVLMILTALPFAGITAFAESGTPDYFYIKNLGNTECTVNLADSGRTKTSVWYSLDKEAATEWTNAIKASFTLGANGTDTDTVYFKGNRNNAFSISKHIGFSSENAQSLEAGGDLTTLLNCTAADSTVCGNLSDMSGTFYKYAFAYMFEDLTSLTNIDNLKLPATAVAEGCCYYMFSNCKGLTSIPENLLPATTIASKCYYGMFKGCTGLISIPGNLLPATTLETDCYHDMFNGCTRLTSLPGNLLPAETLASNCYLQMFNGCTGLTSIPESLLPATTLASNCYQHMFKGCTGLTSIPESLLPATTLANYCYYYMFSSCTGLTSIPEKLLPATVLADYCYGSMFNGCTGLSSIPESLLSATTLANYCYYCMFSSCTGLTSIPENLLPATTLANYCYYSMFSSCTGLISIPENLLPATTLANSCYSYMFNNCTEFTSIPESLLSATTLAEQCYSSMFNNCTGLTSIPESLLPATTLANNCYQYMFSRCAGLTAIPEKLLPATTLINYCYSGMFQNCTGLTSLPENLLPAEILASYCYEYMFLNCTGLTSLPEGLLPATTLANHCYYSMFQKCTGLTSLPEGLLPAETLANYCYDIMFEKCTGLTSLPENLLPATILAEGCYYYMFNACTGLTSLPKKLLPAVTLANYCYYHMFCGCSALEDAPDLPAKSLASNCYCGMFRDCKNLKSLRVNFAQWDLSGNNSVLFLPDSLNEGVTLDFCCPASLKDGINNTNKSMLDVVKDKTVFHTPVYTAAADNAENGTFEFDRFLYIKDDTVIVTAYPAKGYTLNTDDFKVNGRNVALTVVDNNSYAFTMPEANVVITTSFIPRSHSFSADWSYDADAHWHECTDAECSIEDYATCGLSGAAYGEHIDSDEDGLCDVCNVGWITSTNTVLKSGKWIVDSNIFCFNTLTVDGDIEIYLEDMCTLNALGGIVVPKNCNLTVNAESANDDCGSLIAMGKSGAAGIGGTADDEETPEIEGGCGTIIINGGKINAVGGTGAAGIGGGYASESGTVIINDTVLLQAMGYCAIGEGEGAPAPCNITINGNLAVEAGGSQYDITALTYTDEPYVRINYTHGTDYICGIADVSCGFEGEVEVTITNLSDGSIVYEGSTDGSNVYYIDGTVAEGTYLLEASSYNAVTRTYTLTVGSSAELTTVELYTEGDVNGDGVIDEYDYQQAVNIALGSDNILTETSDLSDDADYSLAVADADSDGVIDVLDVALLERKVSANVV